jgi:hypothetical protein
MATATPVVPPLAFFFVSWVIPGISFMHLSYSSAKLTGCGFR